MKSKEEILTEHANADGLRLNDSDWGDWLLKAMDIYAAQEVEKAIAEHEAKQIQMAKEILQGSVSSEQVNTVLDEIIKEAIAEYEAKQWHKYPDEKPVEKKYYLIYDITGIETRYDTDLFDIDDDDWYWHDKEASNVIAWRELPTPYQPQEGGEG